MNSVETANMRGYHYRLEDGKYYIYKNSKRHTTPKGIDVWADNEDLAKAIVSELKKNKSSFTNAASILCYQYTYCDLVDSGNIKLLKDELAAGAKYDFLLGDPFVMLFQGAPVVQAYASFYEEMLPDFIRKQSVNRQIAILVIKCGLGSLALSYLMIKDIVEHEGDLIDNTEAFIDSVIEYCNESEIPWPISSMRKTINTFAFYCTH